MMLAQDLPGLEVCSIPPRASFFLFLFLVRLCLAPLFPRCLLETLFAMRYRCVRAPYPCGVVPACRISWSYPNLQRKEWDSTMVQRASPTRRPWSLQARLGRLALLRHLKWRVRVPRKVSPHCLVHGVLRSVEILHWRRCGGCKERHLG